MNLVCVNCPKGCRLAAIKDGNGVIRVTGNSCPKGIEFATSELECPMRFLTTTVALSPEMAKRFGFERLPVISTEKVPRDRMVEISLSLASCVVSKPLRIGETAAKASGFIFAASCSF
jgi:CxxC motif-containing protein